MELEKRITEAVDYIREKTQMRPKIALILGSGLGSFADTLDNKISIPFSDIPGMPTATVLGHAGAFVFGSYEGIELLVLSGRVHYYEGYSQREITLPVRIMKRLGANYLLLTNAAGGICEDFSSGALMMIKDHINFSGDNPLRGKNLDDFGPRFPDMSDVYNAALREEIQGRAKEAGIALFEGVYVMYSGPNYETPAEIQFFKRMGGDAAGMSTAPEALVANHCGMKVIGISCITNMAAGIQKTRLSHAEVVETANRVHDSFVRLLKICISVFDEHSK